MPSYVTPKRWAAFVMYTSLVSQADTRLLKSAPTLAAGDFKVSIDGGAFANLATLPTNTPGGVLVKISLSSGEMTGDNISVVCSDAAGAEWCDQIINIQTSVRQIDDLAYPSTSGRFLTVDAAGLVDANTVKLGPSGGGTAQTARDIGTSVVASSVLTDVGITQGAADKVWISSLRTLTAAGYQAIWDALVSSLTTAGSIGKRIVDFLDAAVSSRSTYAGGDTAGTTTLLSRIPGTIQPQSGDAYSRLGAPVGASVSADIASVKADTSGVRGDLTTARAIKLDNLDATISSRLAPSGTLAQVTNLSNAPVSGDLTPAMKASVESTVWEAAAASHNTPGTMGNKLNSSASGGSGGGVDPTTLADAILKRDWTLVSGEPARCMLNALRASRNTVTMTDNGDGTGILTVYKEDGATIAYSELVNFDPTGKPVSGVRA